MNPVAGNVMTCKARAFLSPPWWATRAARPQGAMRHRDALPLSWWSPDPVTRFRKSGCLRLLFFCATPRLPAGVPLDMPVANLHLYPDRACLLHVHLHAPLLHAHHCFLAQESGRPAGTGRPPHAGGTGPLSRLGGGVPVLVPVPPASPYGPRTPRRGCVRMRACVWGCSATLFLVPCFASISSHPSRCRCFAWPLCTRRCSFFASV